MNSLLRRWLRRIEFKMFKWMSGTPPIWKQIYCLEPKDGNCRWPYDDVESSWSTLFFMLHNGSLNCTVYSINIADTACQFTCNPILIEVLYSAKGRRGRLRCRLFYIRTSLTSFSIMWINSYALMKEGFWTIHPDYAWNSQCGLVRRDPQVFSLVKRQGWEEWK